MINPSDNTSRITTQNVDKPERLVLRLKARKEDVHAQHEKVAEVYQQQLGKLEASSISSALPLNVQASFIDLADQIDDDFFDCEECLDDLTNLHTEEEILDDEISKIEAQISDSENVSFFERLKGHLIKIIKRENTTLLAALVTAGAGTAVTGGSVLIAISGFELLKILRRHAADTGAEDHLRAIDLSLAAIQAKQAAAERSIERATELNYQVLQDIGEISAQIIELEADLKEATGEVTDLIRASVDNLVQVRGALMQQHQDLNQAIEASEKSMMVLKDQADQINALLKTTYEFSSEDPQKLVERITRDLENIEVSSKTAYEHQLHATHSMLNALSMQSELRKMNRICYDTVAKLRTLQIKLASAAEEISAIEEKALSAEVREKELSERLKETKEAIQETKTELEIAKDQLEKQKQAEAKKFGGESMQAGGLAAMGVGAAAGAAVGGPVGAVFGGVIGFIGIGKQAARVAHRVRQLMRADRVVHKEVQLKKLQQRLLDLKSSQAKTKTVAAAAEESEEFEESSDVIVTGDFGYSRGALLGAYGVKATWNAAANFLNWASGKDIASHLKSSRSGAVVCRFSGVEYTFNFDKLNEDVEKYGAVPLTEQQQLAKTLEEALDQETINPDVILNMLEELSHVSMNGEVIVMVKPDSLAFKTLRQKCERKLPKQD